MASIDVTVTTAPITVTVDDGTTVTVGAGTVGPAGPKGDTGATGAQGPAGATGATGAKGDKGDTGAAGQGVPTGGTTGQVLAKKTGTNYDTEWVDQSGGGGGGSGTVTEVTGTAPISVATGTTTPVVSIAAATTSAAGSMSAADKTKLDGVATGATANATDAQLRDRSTHTGTQALSTISDAGTAAAKNAPATGNASATEVVLGSDTRLTDARTPSTHAASHGSAGSDPITVAQSQVTNLTTDLAGKVPTTRTVNGQALSSDITITATLADGDVTTAKIADGAVTSAKLADGTIVDADVSASAAIAASKISGLATIATSGSASDLSTGTVPTARLNTLAVGGQGAGSQVNEPSVATSLLTSTVTVPVCAAGDVLLVSAGVNFVQNSGGSRNVTFAVKLGATTIFSVTPSIGNVAGTRHLALSATIRVNTTTSQSGSMLINWNTATTNPTGNPLAATGTATETLSSASTLDLLVTATSNTTQNYTLQYLTLTKVAA